MQSTTNKLGLALLFIAFVGAPIPVFAQDEKEDDDKKPSSKMSSGTFSAMKFRSIGPALTSGRIGDFAVDPDKSSHYFVAVCSGGVWKTTNAGTTWRPVFDGQGSYSIGCVTLDPQNPRTVWVGTGENNSQRSVSFGDGVYKSVDGGSSWKNMGLKESEHIGMIAVDPRDSDTVYVAAQGPLWRAGGERGLYKTTDGGKTWNCVLEVSENTGVNEVHLDPRNPDVIYASSYQRRRHVWTLLNGGPESGIHKSTDGGATWQKLSRGLPGGDKGRIGMDISPADPDVIYAIVEAVGDKGGFYRSTNRGVSWSRRSDYMCSSPQYYNEIVCDPHDVNRVYVPDVRSGFTEDGGKTFQRLGGTGRHVDDHAIWIDPDDPAHLLIGGDGGIYETFDHGANWLFKSNLPVTQFYRVTVDNSEPFYYVYGGTQDNNTLGGPSRTLSRGGIANEDWFITVGGDGFVTQVDPVDPNIVYSESQHGGMVRFDRRSGERVSIKPMEAIGEEPLRWNWDTPLLISPHSHTRLYCAANKLFRSEDRGNSWSCISDDLSRGIDRNQLEVMGKVWPLESVSKNRSTSFYGNVVSLDESPLKEGLLYVGTDDGLIHMSPDGGKTWVKYESFPGIPENTYVSLLRASRHAADTVYAGFDNHKMGDFKPYLLKSTDRGQSWVAVTGDLPERDIVYALVEDHVKPELLFVGTEFGVYCSLDGGEKWIRLKGGVPTIAVRDLAIHRRENDLVLGTFGRSFYVLDDYTPLRSMSEEVLSEKAVIFPVRKALQYVPRSRGGSQGATRFTAPNPSFGALITYYMGETIKTRKEKRHEAEKEAMKAEKAPPYPSFDELREEDQEIEPEVFLVVRDAAGAMVSRIPASRKKGLYRVAWNLRYQAASPGSSGGSSRRGGGGGPYVLPGTYSIELAAKIDGKISKLADPQEIEVVGLNLATLPAKDPQAVLAFQKDVIELQRALRGAVTVAQEAKERLGTLRATILATPGADEGWLEQVRGMERRLAALQRELVGDRTISSRNEPAPLSLSRRLGSVMGNRSRTTSAPTQTERDAYLMVGERFESFLAELRQLVEVDLAALEEALVGVGVPWMPGRFPEWKRK